MCGWVSSYVQAPGGGGGGVWSAWSGRSAFTLARPARGRLRHQEPMLEPEFRRPSVVARPVLSLFTVRRPFPAGSKHGMNFGWCRFGEPGLGLTRLPPRPGEVIGTQ